MGVPNQESLSTELSVRIHAFYSSSAIPQAERYTSLADIGNGKFYFK